MRTIFYLQVLLIFSGMSLPSRASDEDFVLIGQNLHSTARPLAEDLATKVATKLRNEKINVVFIQMKKCEFDSREFETFPTPGPANQADLQIERQKWCSAFQIALEKKFLERDIMFLPEGSKNEIREAIANENTYQHSSFNVESSKAIALGRQKAVGSFVFIDAGNEGKMSLVAKARGINLQEGLNTISEVSHSTIATERKLATKTSILSWSAVFGGVGLSAWGAGKAAESQKKSDAYYTEYKAATTREKATEARINAEKQDDLTTIYGNGVISAGVVIALIGTWKLYFGGDDQYSYKLSARFLDRKESTLTQNREPIQITPFLGTNFVSLGIKWQLD